MKAPTLAAPLWQELFLLLVRGPLGIVGPILVILLCLWLARGDRSPWYIKAALAAVLVILVLVMLGGP